jgi:hypothetical protein
VVVDEKARVLVKRPKLNKSASTPAHVFEKNMTKTMGFAAFSVTVLSIFAKN